MDFIQAGGEDTTTFVIDPFMNCKLKPCGELQSKWPTHTSVWAQGPPKVNPTDCVKASSPSVEEQTFGGKKGKSLQTG